MSKKQNFWQNVVAFGKSFLAHVNISFDGAKGSLHIDIIPADSREIVVDGEQMRIAQTPEVKTLTEHTGNANPDNQNTGPDESESDKSPQEDTSTGGHQ